MASSKRSSQSKDSNRRSAARRTSKPKRSTSGGSSSAPDPTRTESKVAARAALDQGDVNIREAQERQAKEQEARQAQELRDGVATGDEKKAAEERAKVGEDNRAALRQPPGAAGEPVGPVGGFVDQTTARPGDALQGHFVKIDLNHDGVPEQLRDSGRDYGVYVEPGEIDRQTGYPLTAIVRLRDETNVQVTVPYAALSPTPYRGR